MKINWLFLSLLLAFALASCNGEGDPDEVDGFPEYTVTIISPTADSYTFDESFHIHVNFDEANDLTIHNVNIQITDNQGNVLYNNPSNSHVQNDSGHLEYNDDFVPAVASGSTLTLTATVWGFEAGISETSATHTFEVE